jgi:rubrerythrin
MAKITPHMIKAIKTAIQMEEEGYEYYMKAAEQTDNDMGKSMFKQLAKDELEHRRTFETMFDTIADPSTWRKLAAETPGVAELPVFQDATKDIGKTKGMTADANALRIGMENEKKSIDYYQKVAGETDDPQAKSIFTNIAQQEEFHYNLLQAELDSITRTGFWFDTAEFRMDGKY